MVTDPPDPSIGVQSLEVDGVPVLWTPGPAPFTAGLVFGVGRRDETFVGGGLTHLVEHLALQAVGRTSVETNATVELSMTEFTATGRPERVADVLRRVCEALQDLPVDRLAVEAQVLRTEDSTVVHPAIGALLAERYGGRGVGLAGYAEPALGALTAQDVRQWAATRFVRGAAAVWLSGPPPDGLALPLPDGAPAVRGQQPLRPLTVPALVEHPVDGAVSLGAQVPPLPGLGAALRILFGRLEDDLRHRRGLSYTVETEHLVVDDERRFLAVRADCRDGREAAVARALWRELARLADEGPTGAELAHDREVVEERLSDARAAVAFTRARAAALVTGEQPRTPQEVRQESRSLSVEQVRAALRAVRDGALLGVPAGVEPAVPGLTAVPSGSSDAVTGQVHLRRRVGSDAPAGSRLVVGDDGVTVDDGTLQTVRWTDALGLLELATAEWSLVGADGVVVRLAPGDWRDGARALERVRGAVPVELQVPAHRLRTDARQVLLLHAPPYAVGEALWPSRADAWLLQEESWTVVVRQEDEVERYVSAAGISAALGRRGAVLLLEQAAEELSVVVLHRGKERDRHVWTGAEHDPSVLAGVLDADPVEVAALLAEPGPPAEVLAALHRTLGVPEQVAQALAGVPVEQVPGFVHEPARGVRDSVRAAYRGEYDPPDSTKLMHRLSRWERERPPAYRAANAALAAGQAVLAVALAVRAQGEWTRRRKAHVAFWALGAVGNLWSMRPPSDRRS